MKRGVIYLDGGSTNDPGIISLDEQERLCREACAEQGIEVMRVWRDDSHSPGPPSQSEMQKALAYCLSPWTKPRVNVVVVATSDPAGTHPECHQIIEEVLGPRETRILTVVLPTLGSNPSHVEPSAQGDPTSRSEQTTKGMRDQALLGRWVWRSPLGYQNATGSGQPSLIPDPSTAPLVALAFSQMATRKHTLDEALAEVTALGLRTRQGRTLTRTTFTSLLRNPLYAGRVVKPEWRVDVKGDFEPIVTPHEFEAVQAVLDGHEPPSTMSAFDTPDFPLDREVECGQCGTMLSGSWQGTSAGLRQPIYCCSMDGCQSTPIPQTVLHGAFADYMSSLRLRTEVEDMFVSVLQEMRSTQDAAATAEESRLITRLRALDQTRQSLIDKFIRGQGIDQQTFLEQSGLIEDDRLRTLSALDESRLSEVNVEDAVQFSRDLLGYLPSMWHRLGWRTKRRFIGVLYPEGLNYENEQFHTSGLGWALRRIEQEIHGSAR